MAETATLAMLHAVNDLYTEIQHNHPELPDVVIVLGASGKSRKRLTHGHFYAQSWAGDKHEIMLSGESLSRGAVATLGTLLHEAAHAYCHVTGVKDTSNNGRYHNAKFRDKAERFGIALESAPTIGWSVTSVPESTQEKYADGLARLDAALTTYRAPKEIEKEKKPTTKRSIKVACECGEDGTVTLPIKFWDNKGEALRCEDCLSGFTVVDE